MPLLKISNYSADLIWRTKMPGLAPAPAKSAGQALKGDRSFSAFLSRT
jgi:hypothetical protein